MDSNFYFLRAQIRVMHPEWTNSQVDAEVRRIMTEKKDWYEDNEDDSCLYCGS
jgi:hypothetical protein